MFIIIPGAYNAQTGVAGASQQGQIVTIGSILKVTERDRRPFRTDPGTPSEIWIDNSAGIGYICKESDTGNGTVWDRLELLGDFVTFGDGDPGAIQDITMGYRPGSLRYARNSEILWICKSNTQGAAVWDVLSSGSSVVSVNGQTGVVQLYLDDLLDVNTTSPINGDVLTWNSATSTWIAAAPTGGGGTYTVNNGLSAQTTPSANPNNFQLGGALIQNTQINALTFYLELIGNLSTPLLRVYNAGTGIAIDATNAGSNPVIKGVSNIGTGVLGISTSNSGVVGISTSGNGLAGSSTSGVGATVSGVKGISSYGNNDVSGEFNIIYTSNNDVKPGINIVRATSSGSALAGIGSSFDFWLPNDVLSTTFQSNVITSKWTDITTGALVSQFEIYGRNTILSRLLAIKGTGQLVLDKYGTGTPFTGTVFKSLGVDSSGNVIEFTGGGGPPITYTSDNAITETANNFQLGGPLVLNTVISGATRTYGIDFSELSYITGTTDQLNVVADNGTDNTQLDISGGGGQIIHTNTVAGSQSAVLLQSSTAALQQISTASGGSIQFTSAFGLFGYYHTPVLTQVQYQVEINSVGIHIVTPNVQASTASVGQVLTLQNATTGQVEFQTSTAGGGGGGRSYYLNGSVIQGTFGSIVNMSQISPVPVIGAGFDFPINTNGYIASFITDAGDPNKAVIPAGNWNFELWFSANNPGGSPNFYVELSKYDTVGGTFTPIATSSATPEGITNGIAINLYFTALSVPQTPLLLTDRLAVRVFVNNSGRTITLHTQGPHLSQIITDFPSGIVSLNGLTAFTQNFATPGTTGLAPNWNSALDTHTLNIPLASAASVTAGLISKTEYDTFNGKQDALTLTTTGTSGAATLIGATLNIPQYSGGSGGNSIGELTSDVTAGPATLPSQSVAATLKANLKTGSFGVTIDGITSVIQVGQVGYVVMPYAGTITGWSITTNVAGNVSFDIWKDTLIDTMPTLADSIVGGVYPSITATNFGTSTSLGSWTSTTFLAGHIFGFYINPTPTVKNATLTLRCTKS